MRRMNRYIIIVMFLFAALYGCHTGNIKKNIDGIDISFTPKNDNAVRTMRLQVISDNIIRVISTPEKVIKERKSLIALSPKIKTKWTVEEIGDSVLLKTATMQAIVSITTGEISFTDNEGCIILAEQHGGGKSFEPIEVDGTKGYTFRQVFESPTDEAFYGLGQHQSDEFNWKGRNEELFQYNTKVSVPFVVSSNNYGILWDNYSLSRFGDPRPYANLNDMFDVFGKDGDIGGLTATYMVNKDPNNVFVTRRETNVDYENIQTILNFPKDFPFNNAAIRWEGEIQPHATGIYRFNLYYAGYTSVYIDDNLVVPERWRTAWNPNSYKFELALDSTRRHKLRIEWQPDGGVSYVGLKALSPVPDNEQQKLSLWSEMGQYMDYYFVRGNNIDEVISGYRTITGKAELMPKWAMGFWQSRERYKTQDEVLSALKEFRQRQIPIDNIVLDWNYWPETEWGSHKFDLQRFPNPKAMVDSIHSMDAQIMISVWPKFYHTTDNFKAFKDMDAMYMRAVEDSIRDWVGPGYVGSFYDAYNEKAQKLFWKQLYEKLYSLGIDAWWMDASEPNVRDCTDMDYRKALCGPTALGSSTEYFNAYALMNAKAIYEGLRSVDKNKRIFQLTRSGFAGLQRYSTATWSGDIATRWEDMKAQIPAGINFSMSGIPYWTMDNGGFCVEKRYELATEGSDDREEWRELNARWHQFGTFVPIFRTHGQFPFREIWNIAPETHPAYKTMLYYTQLRYKLMPYIYTQAARSYFDDYSMMRGLIMDFPEDKNVRNIGDQYMFGSSLMVCPVYEFKARSRKVYFPAGTDWYDIYTGKIVKGGQMLTVVAPYDRMPLYVPAGSILPLGEVVQHTKIIQNDLTLYVYAGKDGEFSLYEDEALNYNYQNGKFSEIQFKYSESDKILSITKRKGDFDGLVNSRIFRIIYVNSNNVNGIDKTEQKSQIVKYDGESTVIQL